MAEPEEPLAEAPDVEEDHAEDTGESGDNQAIANQLQKNPAALVTAQDKQAPVAPSFKVLPLEVSKRIRALKKLQSEVINIETEFYKEVNALELKYASQYLTLNEKRKEILTASREPTEEECNWPSDDEEKDELRKIEQDALQDKAKAKAATEEAGGDGAKTEVKGIPDFWLTVFSSVEMLADLVQEHDEPILRHLQDIQVVLNDTDPKGFTLEFYFEPNEFFTDTVLTKRYEMRYGPDPEDKFAYEGPEIVKCTGCTINWNKGKNVTVKQVKKKQKHKGRGLIRTVTKQVQADSFFNFFTPPTVPEGSESDVNEETETLLNTDFEIGHFIRERLVPRAVLFFTGEAVEDDDFDDEESEESSSSGEDNEYEEERTARNKGTKQHTK